MNNSRYIRTKDKEISSPFCTVGKIMASILIVYYIWYNELYDHNALIVYGSFIILVACVVIDMLIDQNVVEYKRFHIGIWMNFIIGIYALVTGVFVSFNIDALFESLRVLVQYSVIIFAFYYLALKSRNGLDWIIITIHFSALLCCFFLFRSPYQYINGRYTMSARNNPNALGVFLALGIFAISYRVRPDLKSICIALPQIGLMLYAIIMTGSKKSLIAAIILVSFTMLNIITEGKRSLSRERYFFLLIVIITIVVIGGKYIYDYYQSSRIAERMQTMMKTHDEEENRILYYAKAWELFLERPIWGGGLEQFEFWSGFGTYAHSTYAEAIADFGFVGSAIYFTPIIIVGYSSFNSAFFGNKTYRSKLVFTLLVTELFLGIGQIFFIDFAHYLALLIIYYVTNLDKLCYTTIHKHGYKFIR